MKRYLLVNDEWIDTLKQAKAGFYYYVVNGFVYYLYDECMVDIEVGFLQAETDTLRHEKREDE